MSTLKPNSSHIDDHSKFFDRPPPKDYVLDSFKTLESFTNSSIYQSNEPSILIFTLENHFFAIQIKDIFTIHCHAPAVPIPFKSSNHFKGLVQVNNNLYLLFSLHHILNTPVVDNFAASKILILQSESEVHRFAFYINDTHQIISQQCIKNMIDMHLPITSRFGQISERFFEFENRQVCLINKDKLLEFIQRSYL